VVCSIHQVRIRAPSLKNIFMLESNIALPCVIAMISSTSDVVLICAWRVYGCVMDQEAKISRPTNAGQIEAENCRVNVSQACVF
jgi:hypothetical protein